MLRCLIIDDEELARSLIKSYIDKVSFLELTGSFDSPIDAMTVLKEGIIDVVFLDIQMPDLKGTTFAKMIPKNTQVIFTTAYSEYALEGFELNATDYLLKPITYERFLMAVNKLEGNDKLPSTDTITIKSGYDLHKLLLDDIIYIESDGEYVNFHTSNGKIMSYMSLKSLESTLDSSIFMRVHRSYMINKTKVTALKGRDVLLSEKKIPVSDRYYELVKKELF